MAPVQQRLREGRLVAFVVAPPAVAVHVDDDVALELAAKVHRQPHDLRHGLRIFAVDVEDRDLQHLGHVGGVGARPRFVGRRGEADLVVDDDVQRAADRVAGQLAEVERLLHDPFAGERGVAVDQNAPCRACASRRRRGPAWRARGRCATGLTNSRWLGLKQSERCTLLPRGGHPVAAVAQVVLHVAAAQVQLGIEVRELAEDLPAGSCP